MDKSKNNDCSGDIGKKPTTRNPVECLVKGPRTKMVSWRGGEIEFCRTEGLGLNSTAPAKPPWWIVRYRGKLWHRYKWNYCWLDYGGPPQIFLTRQQAEIKAKAFRNQYGGGEQYGRGPLKVEVVKLNAP